MIVEYLDAGDVMGALLFRICFNEHTGFDVGGDHEELAELSQKHAAEVATSASEVSLSLPVFIIDVSLIDFFMNSVETRRYRG